MAEAGTEASPQPEAAPAPSTEGETTTEAPAEPATDTEKEPAPEEEDHHVMEGTAEGAIAIISDVDMLFDYFMGDAERGAGRDNNNVDFIMNLVEYLVGDQDLLNIRGKDSTSRPFTAINKIREDAAKKQVGPRAEIKAKIAEARKALQEGQEGQDIGGGLMIIGQSEESLEKVREIEELIRDEQRKESKISRDQRNEIQAAINTHKWRNMLLTPTIVIIIGLFVGFKRKLKTAAK